MNKLRILYTGWVYTGRRTSLSVISKYAKPIFDPTKDKPFGWNFIWDTGKGVYDLQVSKTWFRSWKIYKNLFEIKNDPDAKSEIEFLNKVDGLIFVVDSQIERFHFNEEFLFKTYQDLIQIGRNPNDVQVIFQLNKRDLANIVEVEELKNRLQWSRCDYVETTATEGLGVVEALNRLIQLIEQVKGLDLSAGKVK